MQAAKNDVGFLQLIDSGLHSSYCALEKARSLLGRATQRTMEIVHVTPATIFHVRQTLTVDGQQAFSHSLHPLLKFKLGHYPPSIVSLIHSAAAHAGRASRPARVMRRRIRRATLKVTRHLVVGQSEICTS